jgi:SAM-dependent methyltransferase
MGSVTRFDLACLLDTFGCGVFIETGTGLGDGLAHAGRFGFDRLLSVELMETLAAVSRERFRCDHRVEVRAGRSEPILEGWLATLDPDTPVLFWLDAHFPGADFQAADYSAEPDPAVRLPLERELSVIRRLRPSAKDVILIDDLRIYRDGPFEGSNIPPHAQTLPPALRNTAFFGSLLAGYRLIYSFRDEGYVLAVPPAPSFPASAFFSDGQPAESEGPAMKECAKACARRAREPAFSTAYFVGEGLDVGGAPDPLSLYADFFPLMRSVQIWDWDQGDAQFLHGIPDARFDFVHSSHCLEHMRDPPMALANWFRAVKPGGHLVVLIPDEDLYEQGVWPSTFNGDHKATFTVNKARSWSPVSHNLFSLIEGLGERAELKLLQVLDCSFRRGLPRFDQTMTPVGESAIEIVVRKRTDSEIAAGGRLPLPGEVPPDLAYLMTGLSAGTAAVQVDGLAALSAQRGQLVADLEARVAELQRSLTSAESDLQDLKHSTSWRITAPARALARRLRAVVSSRRSA